jgi:hypothetical protein
LFFLAYFVWCGVFITFASRSRQFIVASCFDNTVISNTVFRPTSSLSACVEMENELKELSKDELVRMFLATQPRHQAGGGIAGTVGGVAGGHQVISVGSSVTDGTYNQNENSSTAAAVGHGRNYGVANYGVPPYYAQQQPLYSGEPMEHGFSDGGGTHNGVQRGKFFVNFGLYI